MARGRLMKTEAILRFLALVLTMATAILIGTNRETEEVFGLIKRTANLHSLQASIVLVTTDSIATGYLLAQLCKNCWQISRHSQTASSGSSVSITRRKGMAWINFALDQGMAYATFAVTTATTQGSYFAVKGEPHFQWMKLCNIYTHFCNRVALALVCGLAGSFFIGVVASISAYRLFRLYSVKRTRATKG